MQTIDGGVVLEWHQPLTELQIAFGAPLLPDTDLPARRQALEDYLLRHLALRSESGAHWHSRVLGMEMSTLDAVPDLVTRIESLAPAGESTRRFVLRSDAVVHEVVNHKTVVMLARDFGSGLLSQEPRMLGQLNFVRLEMPVDLGRSNAWLGLRVAMALGMGHIAEGADHVLFLLVLLLPAPLAAAGGRWARVVAPTRAAWRLAGIVTAFTLGHSVTLALCAMGWVVPPAAPVEVLIAVSILVAALHAMRPLFPGREAWIAGAFGLVHGLAFGGVIAAMGFGGASLVWTLLGFNLGVEAAQLVVLAVALPLLMLLATEPWYRPFRLAWSGLAALAALAWIAERAAGWRSPILPAIDAAAQRPWWLLGAVVAVVVAARVHRVVAGSRRSGAG